jgi:hypothetical protein
MGAPKEAHTGSSASIAHLICVAVLAAALTSSLSLGVSTYLQRRAAIRDHENVAVALRESIADEVDRAIHIQNAYLPIEGEGGNAPAWPFQLQRPAVYYDVRPRIFKLTPTVVAAVVHFDSQLSSISAFQDMMEKRSGDDGPNVVRETQVADELQKLIVAGNGVLSAIEDSYPNLPRRPPRKSLPGR